LTERSGPRLFPLESPVEGDSPRKNVKVGKAKGGCDVCPLLGRSIVRPTGNLKEAKLVIVGQAPGSREVQEGKPFVGPAGRKLWQELRAFGIYREDCYVTNIVKCWPGRTGDGTGDKVPDAKTRKSCTKQWEFEWESMEGKVILVLGGPATKHCTGRALTTVRGQPRADEKGNKWLATWHPAFIIRPQGAVHTGVWRKDLSILPDLVHRTRRRHQTISYTLITTPGGLAELDYLLSDECVWFSVDLETTSKRPSDDGSKILSVALSSGVRTFVVDWDALGAVADGALKRVLESDKPKVAQNAKFEVVWLRAIKDICMRNIVFDPSIAQYLLDEGTGTSVRLKQLVWKYLPEFGGYEEEIDVENMEEMPKDKLYEYNALDAYVTTKISEILLPKVLDEGFGPLLSDVYLPAIYPIAEMEAEGFQIDIDELHARKRQLERRLTDLHDEIMGLPSVRRVPDFRLTSTPSLRKLFYGVLGMRPTIRSKTGVASLTKDMLETWAQRGVREAQKILDYKRTRKVLKTYYENYEKLVDSNFRLHPVYNMMIAKGGRIAAGSPNIMNVPKPERAIFVSRFADGCLVQMDFKQIEMRVMAFESRDPGLLKIFREGGDPHAEVAAEILGKRVEDVTPLERQHAKAINFGLFYGMQAKTLADREKMPLDQATRFWDGFFARFPKVREWQERQREKMMTDQKVVSLFGFRRDLSTYMGEDKVKRAYNTPIQSAAAHINLFSLGSIWEMMKREKLKAVMVATIHDSLVVDCPESELLAVQRIMNTVVDSLPEHFRWMIAPMAIDITVGANWRDAS